MEKKIVDKDKVRTIIETICRNIMSTDVQLGTDTVYHITELHWLVEPIVEAVVAMVEHPGGKINIWQKDGVNQFIRAKGASILKETNELNYGLISSPYIVPKDYKRSFNLGYINNLLPNDYTLDQLGKYLEPYITTTDTVLISVQMKVEEIIYLRSLLYDEWLKHGYASVSDTNKPLTIDYFWYMNYVFPGKNLVLQVSLLKESGDESNKHFDVIFGKDKGNGR